MAQPTRLKCDICQAIVGRQYPVAFLFQPCLHVVCVRCYHQTVAAVSPLRCPCTHCHEWVQSSKLVEIAHPTSSSSAQQRQQPDEIREVQEVTALQPDEQLDPFRFWAMKDPALNTGMIYVSYRHTQDEATFYKSTFQMEQKMDEDSADELVKVFARVFHPLLFYGDHGKREGNHKRSLAMRCLYALSSGSFLSKQNGTHIYTAERDRTSHGAGDRGYNDDDDELRLEQSFIDGAATLAKKLLDNLTAGSLSTSLEPSSPPISPTDLLDQIASPTAMSPFLSRSFEDHDHDNREGPAFINTQVSSVRSQVVVTPDATSPPTSFRIAPSLEAKILKNDDDEGKAPFPYVLIFMLVSAILMISE